MGRIDNAAFWRQVGAALEVTFSQEFQDTIWQEWHGAVPIPAMKALVKEVKAAGFRTIVFSNILSTSAAEIRKNGGYEDFDAEVLSFQAGKKKPDSGIYADAIEAARCRPEECIFIDDRPGFLAPARAMGMTTILATSTEQVIADLRSMLGK